MNLLNAGWTFFDSHHVLQNVLDIAIVAWLIYRMILLIRGTRTVSILVGFVLLLALLYLSQRVGFNTLHWITNNFFSSIVLVIVILFQADIRAALSQVGYGSFFGGGQHARAPRLVSALTTAAYRLSAKRIGALIVVERRIGLREYISLGTPIDAEPSADLLMAIFHTQSPIHDGAVIIQNGRVATAGCFLPLSTDANIDRRFGTRHRAALGISKESDALVIVVSEETGAVSLVHRGEIHFNLDEASFNDELKSKLGVAIRRKIPDEAPPKPARA